MTPVPQRKQGDGDSRWNAAAEAGHLRQAPAWWKSYSVTLNSEFHRKRLSGCHVPAGRQVLGQHGERSGPALRV